jgi:hypothetical protein
MDKFFISIQQYLHTTEDDEVVDIELQRILFSSLSETDENSSDIVMQQYCINCRHEISLSLPLIREQLNNLALDLYNILMVFSIERKRCEPGSILVSMIVEMDEEENEIKNKIGLDKKSNEKSYLSVMISVYRIWNKIQEVINEGFHALYDQPSERLRLLVDMIRAPSSYYHILPGLSRGLERSCYRQEKGFNLYHSICLGMYGDRETPPPCDSQVTGPSTSSKEPSSLTKELFEENLQPHASNEQPSSNNEEPSSNNEEPSSTNVEPSSSKQSVAINTEESSPVDNSDPSISINELETLLRHIRSHHLSDQRIDMNPFSGLRVFTYIESMNTKSITLNDIYNVISTRNTVASSLFEIVRSILAAVLYELRRSRRNMDTDNNEESLLTLIIDCICLDVKGIFLLYDNGMNGDRSGADKGNPHTEFNGDQIKSFLDKTFTSAVLPFLTILYTQNNDIESIKIYLPFALKLLELIDNLCMKKEKDNVHNNNCMKNEEKCCSCFTVLKEWLEDHLKWVRIDTCCICIEVYVCILCIYIYIYR